MDTRGSVLSEQQVRDLASRIAHPAVTSLYLDVDGRRHPRQADYENSLEHLFRQARRQVEEDGASTELRRSVYADLERIRAWVSNGIDRARTRGLAFFSCNGEDWFEAFALPGEVHDEATVAPRPSVMQLWELLHRSRSVLAVMVDRSQVRSIRCVPGETSVVGEVVDEVPRDVDEGVNLGGFSHYLDEAALRHLRRGARSVSEAARRWSADAIVLSGPPEAVAELERLLPPDVRRSVVARLSLAAASTAHEVSAAVSEICHDLEKSEDRNAISRLLDQAATGYRSSVGLGATMRSLDEHKVGTLLLASDLSVAGAACTQCEYLGTGGRLCPLCGAELQALEDVVPLVVTVAVAQRADVVLAQDGELAAVGNIGVLERY